MTMIEIDSLFQPALEVQRHRWDEPQIDYYVRHPDKIRGVVVFENPADGERILANGHHRVEAAKRLGWTQVDADVRAGTRVDASRYWDPVRRPWQEIESEADPSGQRPE